MTSTDQAVPLPAGAITPEMVDLGADASDTPAAVVITGLRANPRWAAVLDAIEADARAEEREACAQLAEEHNAIYPAVTDSSDLVKALPFADLIRAMTAP